MTSATRSRFMPHMLKLLGDFRPHQWKYQLTGKQRCNVVKNGPPIIFFGHKSYWLTSLSGSSSPVTVKKKINAPKMKGPDGNYDGKWNNQANANSAELWEL